MNKNLSGGVESRHATAIGSDPETAMKLRPVKDGRCDPIDDIGSGSSDPPAQTFPESSKTGKEANDAQRWAEVAMDFLKSGNLLDATISLQACIDSLSPASKPSWEAQPFTPLGCSGGCA